MPQRKHKPEEIVAKLRQVDVLLSQGRPVAVHAIRSPVVSCQEITVNQADGGYSTSLSAFSDRLLMLPQPGRVRVAPV